MTYKTELIKSMNYLSKKKNTLFIGQSVLFSGNAIFNTLEQVPKNKKIEMPVFEDVQAGFCTGLALQGFIPICIYPRFDFLILAMNQIVNHLDKIRLMSSKDFKPKVIIRTSIGSKSPLNGGVQHTQDYTKIFKSILTEIELVRLTSTKQIFNTYKKAYLRKDSKSTLIIENGDSYNKK